MNRMRFLVEQIVPVLKRSGCCGYADLQDGDMGADYFLLEEAPDRSGDRSRSQPKATGGENARLQRLVVNLMLEKDIL